MSVARRRRVGPSDPLAVVSRFVDAANHHDTDALYANVHPDFESLQPLHPARNFRGPGQLIANWKAIFEAEPGFRLSVLRASTTGNTVWVEVHGAGASAEAAGVFIVGVEDGRIRWIRVYSDLVEPLPEEPAAPAPETAPPLHLVDAEEGGAPPEPEAGPRRPPSGPETEAVSEPVEVLVAPSASDSAFMPPPAETAEGEVQEAAEAGDPPQATESPAAAEPAADEEIPLFAGIDGTEDDGPRDHFQEPPAPKGWRKALKLRR
ncbi:MAG: nuclear transport factor 2 family protein [Acidimicrobiales bacterium]